MLTILSFILSYLIGSIPSALIVGKIGFGIDIREHGSGNLGGTNALRSLGKKAGLTVYVMDILKGVVAALLALMFGLDVAPILVGIPAVIGHCYPIFAGFRGGKAVATGTGLLIVSSFPLFLSALVVFILTLVISKYVSLASILSALTTVIYSILFLEQQTILATMLLFIVVTYRHHSNIKRILNKTESKIKFNSKKK